jgi:hypothetical protein
VIIFRLLLLEAMVLETGVLLDGEHWAHSHKGLMVMC